MIKVNVEQGSEAWHEAKLGLFSGTSFSTVVSGKDTKGYKDLILNVAGQMISGQKDETYSNANMERGIELEPEAKKEYESLFEVEVEEVGLCLMDDLDEWVGVSPDGLVDEIGGLEIKCPLMKTHLSYMNAGKLPTEYKWQVQGALFVTGREWWDFMSYYPNLKPFIFRVEPDLEMHDKLKGRLIEAIEDVKVQIAQYKQYNSIQIDY